MGRLTVLVGENVGEANLDRMRTGHPDIEFLLCPTPEAFLESVPKADIIFTKRWPPETIGLARRLRWVQAGTAGVERYLGAGLRESEVPLTNASGAHGVPMSEAALAMMLSFATGLYKCVRSQAERLRLSRRVISQKFELEGQTLCVLGLGDIGGTLARKSKKLGMRVLGVRRSREVFPGIDAQYTSRELLDALPAADHVALCLPLTPETRGIVGVTELQAMQSSAYIYNVGRGATIDADALVSALAEGRIAGAGLDVTDPEPLPQDSPLWDMPNVLLSHHTSGSSPFNADRITRIFLENLARFLKDEPLVNRVNKELGY